MCVHETWISKANNCYTYAIISSLGSLKLGTCAIVRGLGEGEGDSTAGQKANSFQTSCNGGNKVSSFIDKKYCSFYVWFHLYLPALPCLVKKY